MSADWQPVAMDAWRSLPRTALGGRSDYPFLHHAVAAAAAWSGAAAIGFGIWGPTEVDMTTRAVAVFGCIAALVTLVIRHQAPPVHSARTAITMLVGAALWTPIGGVATLWLLEEPPGLAALAATVAIGATAATLLNGLSRAERRAISQRHAARVIVVGAGTGGEFAIRAIDSDPEQRYRAVALLDDEPDARNRRIHGLRVLGGREQIAELADCADALLIAIPSAEGPTVTELFDLATHHGLDVLTLPPKRDLFDRSEVEPTEIREPLEADLLGRRRIDTDVASIAGYLQGRTVLVTGAGGSIGSELCRQLHAFGPERLVMLDRDESALHAVQLSIDGQGMLDTENLVLGDIRDHRRMEAVFAHHRPEVVFHAAALKHLPLLERYPGEALRTNVQATVLLLELAQRFEVDRFVNVSSDKAANPISVLGYSKRLSERLTAFSAGLGGSTKYMSVRFGNVLGSRGSVLTAFHEQLLAGQPLVITHPEVARYFMTVEEAVELVIQAGAIGAHGDAMVLDMGDPVRIVDVARRLAANAGIEPEIVYTNLRPGEKLVEDLFGEEETVRPTAHGKITAAEVPAIDPLFVDRLDPSGNPRSLTDALLRLCYTELDGTGPLEIVPDALPSHTG